MKERKKITAQKKPVNALLIPIFLWIISVASLVCRSFTGRGFEFTHHIQEKTPPMKGGTFSW